MGNVEVMGFVSVLDAELVTLVNIIGVLIYVDKPIIMDSVKWFVFLIFQTIIDKIGTTC